MSLLSEAEALIAIRSQCTVGALVGGELGPEIAEALVSNVPATAIARALELRGIRVGADALQRHRRRACQCQRS